MRPHIKCNACGLAVDTMREFDEQVKRKEWYTAGDGWTWEWYHNCDKYKENKAKEEK
ncbi:hypothetical protein JL_40 [Bacillus phage JL]|uniref:Uncharacterized protein n=1 Tax=Bacillus phage JL TaxID=1296655 RepID=S5MAC8_9CAUD|nr:hypothetical protein AVV47_gp040 [Bacillus phage JL]AGR46729.1 hypothetical protein JL_40 [Bacillus phage JL]